MPAILPPERPWGRTEAAGKRSSCASLVAKTSSVSSERSSTAPTSLSPGSSLITPRIASEDLGIDALDDAARSTQRQPSES